jgi:hypothetical protein
MATFTETVTDLTFDVSGTDSSARRKHPEANLDAPHGIVLAACLGIAAWVLIGYLLLA